MLQITQSYYWNFTKETSLAFLLCETDIVGVYLLPVIDYEEML